MEGMEGMEGIERSEGSEGIEGSERSEGVRIVGVKMLLKQVETQCIASLAFQF